jgi:methylated-DNA-[protein]-cysteine S-methyltransferase
MTTYTILKTTSVGDLLLVATAGKLTGVYFRDCEHAPVPADDWKLDPRPPVLQQAAAELQEYLGGRRRRFSLPLHQAGTDFQEEIWRQIALVPFGGTITYAELARRAGAPNAVRATGAATGQNSLSIIIPCHRVVGKNGSLTGYAGGLDRKQRLLGLEMKPLNCSLDQAAEQGAAA